MSLPVFPVVPATDHLNLNLNIGSLGFPVSSGYLVLLI
jgi:hypothetical protein